LVIQGQNRRRLQTSLIEGEISGGKAMLSTTLDQHKNTAYDFDMADKIRQDSAPPAAIKIERLPTHGKIVITQHDGTTKELKEGDIVQTEFMSNFKYEQGEEGCSIQKGELCNDQFLYSTLSSWIGYGQETQAEIKLTPVEG
jgi:hypothetical protein